MVAEREEFESAETPVDEVLGPDAEVDDRRKAVHERGRAAAEEMRGSRPNRRAGSRSPERRPPTPAASPRATRYW